jgi:threonine synthase
VLARSNGTVLTLSEQQLLDAWRLLSTTEGLFCEPASAAGIAAVQLAGLAPGTRVVCVVTGHGLKDPDAVEAL